MARRKSSCRYCGKLGHTRRGCKDYKDYLKREMEAGSYWAKEEYTRNTQTKCSYCQTYGHNRRVCDGRKGDIKTNSQEIYDTRLKMRERLRDIGLGSGALVQYETSGWVEDGGYVRKMTARLVRAQLLWQQSEFALPGLPHKAHGRSCNAGVGSKWTIQDKLADRI